MQQWIQLWQSSKDSLKGKVSSKLNSFIGFFVGASGLGLNDFDYDVSVYRKPTVINDIFVLKFQILELYELTN